MSRFYIYKEVEALVRRYGTRDPFAIMQAMGIRLKRYNDLNKTKGFTRYFLRLYFVGLNDRLPEVEQRIVAAHELGHIILHSPQLREGPMLDTAIYDMRSATEYDANMFAADLLLSDEDVEEAMRQEDISYDALCRSLYTTPDLMSFKLFSMKYRGSRCPIPQECNSRFLADTE